MLLNLIHIATENKSLMNVSSGLEEKVIWEMLQLRKSLPGFFFFLVNMFLINIPFIQAQQRLVGPTGSDTGGW